MKRLSYTLLSLVVALPLGAGGFCCCLIGHGHDDPAPVVAVHAESHCCSDSEAPAPAAPEQEHRCECPARELAVFAKTTTSPALYESPFVGGDLLLPPVMFAVLPKAEAAPVSPVAHPPPRPPLERSPSVLRC